MKRFVHELRYSRKSRTATSSAFTTSCICRALTRSRWSTSRRTRCPARFPTAKPMALKKVPEVFASDICTGMAVAHQAGVIHRDLKPANILVNDEGLLKIVDFGVAAAASSGDTQLTKTGYVIGSPEVHGTRADSWQESRRDADIYSVGVIMYEMATGIPAIQPR